MGKYGDYDDPAHDADMDALRREQLAADIGPDELDDLRPDDCDIVLDDDDEEDRYWVAVHHQPRE